MRTAGGLLLRPRDGQKWGILVELGLKWARMLVQGRKGEGLSSGSYIRDTTRPANSRRRRKEERM